MSRKGIWFGWFLPGLPVSLLVGFIDSALPSGEFLGMKRAELLLAIASFWPLIAISVKRVHDTNLSGLILIPIWAATSALSVLALYLMKQADHATIGVLLAFATLAPVFWLFYLRPGTLGANRFGPDPLGQDSHQHAD